MTFWRRPLFALKLHVRTARMAIALCAVVALTSPTAAGAASQPAGAPVRIPPVRGTSFGGQTIALPEGLGGRVGVLVLGFTQASRGQVTDWGHRLANDYLGSGVLAYYEMPVLESVPRLLRGLVLGRIKASVSDRARPTFLPILDHEAEWRRAAGLTRQDDACVLLVDPHGQVLWRAQGAVNDAVYAELQRRVAQARARQ